MGWCSVPVYSLPCTHSFQVRLWIPTTMHKTSGYKEKVDGWINEWTDWWFFLQMNYFILIKLITIFFLFPPPSLLLAWLKLLTVEDIFCSVIQSVFLPISCLLLFHFAIWRHANRLHGYVHVSAMQCSGILSSWHLRLVAYAAWDSL